MKRDVMLYLDDVWESIEAIREYTRSVAKSEFMADRKLQDAVIRRLETIGEAVKHIPEDIRAKHGRVPWKEIAGMRDVLIHEYFAVKMLRVWYAVKHDLPALRRVIAAMRKAPD